MKHEIVDAAVVTFVFKRGFRFVHVFLFRGGKLSFKINNAS